jgi:hypothetical protein
MKLENVPVLPVLASPPASPVAGMMYVEATTYLVRVYDGTAWQSAARGASVPINWPIGTYKMPGIIYVNANPTIHQLKLAPIIVPKRIMIDEIAIEVVAAVAASFFRAGLYADNGDGYPGAILHDSGQFDTSTTGVKTSSTNLVLNPGTYWVGGATQGAAAQLRTIAYPEHMIGVDGLNANNYDCYQEGGVTGALPGSFTTSKVLSSNSPRVALRRSA